MITTKNQINKLLASESINYGYSGKDKIYYVDKLPSGNLLMDIEKAGFKVLQRMN